MRVNSMPSGTKLSPMRAVVQRSPSTHGERARLGQPAEEERGRKVRALGGSGCRGRIPRAGVRAMLRRARRGRSGRLTAPISVTGVYRDLSRSARLAGANFPDRGSGGALLVRRGIRDRRRRPQPPSCGSPIRRNWWQRRSGLAGSEPMPLFLTRRQPPAMQSLTRRALSGVI